MTTSTTTAPTVTHTFILGHLWAGGTLQMRHGGAIFTPNVGPWYWRELDVPVALMRQLMRSRSIRVCCSHRPHHNVRYYCAT
jgi:hypothetical protein